jgi:hypothetical protein
MREDGTITVGILRYHPDIDPDEVLLELEPHRRIIAA